MSAASAIMTRIMRWDREPVEGQAHLQVEAAAALLLTGGVGAGKTTLAVEIGEILRQNAVPHAVIDLDWLAWCEPRVGVGVVGRRELLIANLAAVWQNYRRQGIRRVVLAGGSSAQKR
jgi:energy-coupling factor transporter ATP-binding protein EcfA2